MSNIHFELFKFMNEHGDKTQDVRKSVTPDREKVIKALECCTSADGCLECPYSDSGKGTDHCQLFSTRDALALLKEQDTVEHALRTLEANGWRKEDDPMIEAMKKMTEPVAPKTHDAWPAPIKACGSCGACLYCVGDYKPKFCAECGRAVKWDG